MLKPFRAREKKPKKKNKRRSAKAKYQIPLNHILSAFKFAEIYYSCNGAKAICAMRLYEA